jgi:hypothetical protein
MWRRMLLFILILTGSALGQEIRRLEANVDYGYLSMKVPNATKPVDMNGIQVGITANANRWLGLGVDFGGYYHCITGCTGYGDLAHNSAFSVLVGPRVRLRPGRNWQPFVQGSAGMLNIGYRDELNIAPSPTGVGVVNASQSSHSGLAWAAGGGVDWMRGRFVVRVAQFDFYQYTVAGRAQNTGRFTAGIRWQFGGMRK